MTKKKKQDEEKEAAKIDGQTEPMPKEPEPGTGQPNSESPLDISKHPRRKRLFRRAKAGKRNVPVSTLAASTKTDSILFAALKSSYGWTDKTKLTREEFIRLREDWLNKPVREVKP